MGRVDVRDFANQLLCHIEVVLEGHTISLLIVESVLGSLPLLNELLLLLLLLLHLLLLLLLKLGSGPIATSSSSILRRGKLAPAHLCILEEVYRVSRDRRS